jgi:hypothetical protein
VLDDLPEGLCRRSDRIDVVRGRLDAHERGEVVEHRLEVDHRRVRFAGRLAGRLAGHAVTLAMVVATDRAVI